MGNYKFYVDCVNNFAIRQEMPYISWLVLWSLFLFCFPHFLYCLHAYFLYDMLHKENGETESL